jgi:transcriptional regulator with XRE-family HTH domain
MRERTAGPNAPQKFRVAIRRAFYEGLTRECLDWAWVKLSEFQQQKPLKRLFRGEIRERTPFPLEEIANRLARSTGEVSKWFAGKSPSWANLMMVMTVLDADWPHLQNLPAKPYRRSAGCMSALRLIRSELFGESPRPADPPHHVVQCLDMLFRDEQWISVRQEPDLRAAALARIAAQAGVSVKHLEEADQAWGNSFASWLGLYAEGWDEQIWR